MQLLHSKSSGNPELMFICLFVLFCFLNFPKELITRDGEYREYFMESAGVRYLRTSC